jgi:DNA-binding LytR/AlgR family response regulator
MNRPPTALIAEDEPLLAAELKKLLRQAWPELEIVAAASDGVSATALALDATPDILFLDIKMPGRTGLAVAEAVIDEWPDARPTPLVVFITAYDEYALAAFEHQAADYVLKPATAERIARTVERLRTRLAERTPLPAEGDLARLLQNLQNLVPSGAGTLRQEGRLTAIHVGIGNHVRIVQTADILFFEATDKYVNVHTSEGEGLIRMSMRDLIDRLDPAAFIQVHRAVVVNRSQIVMATRDEAGRMSLKLRDCPSTIGVSRAFVHHFRAM